MQDGPAAGAQVQQSERITSLYGDMYEGGVARGWRDAGAVDKANNIVRICQQAGLPQNPRVIELGCGEGAVAAALVARGFTTSYVGYDLSPSGIAEARARAVPGAEFHIATGDRMPLADDSADLVVLCHVVEHLEHPRALINEARRLAPCIAVEVPLELHARLPRDYVWDELGHINKYTSTSVRQLVQTCGLDIVAQFTSQPGKHVAQFFSTAVKTRAAWHVKRAALAAVPPVARSLFTYHETLLGQRSASKTG